MSNHVALSSMEHRDLRIKTERSNNLGDGVMSCITFPVEFRNVQNQYPIVFQLNAERDAFNALALFGFEHSENLFLNGGGWDARYRPLALDIQPLLIGRSREEGYEKQVHIDMGSPRVGHEDGIRLFDQDGKPTEFLESMTQKLQILDEGYQAASAYLETLQKYELLEPFALEIELRDGSKNRLVGFHTINEEKLRELDASSLSAMNQAGYLFPTYMALASLSNFTALIERKNMSLAHGG